MKLIGSTTSPYVRKIRVLLYGTDYEFEKLGAPSAERDEIIKSYSPIKRIPILVVEQRVIFDSTIISEYLLDKKGIKLSIDEKLKLRLIDELCDSGISLFQQKLWGIDPDWKDKRSQTMISRATLILDELEESVANLNDIQKDWLFCVLDWLNFKVVIDWEADYKKLKNFYDTVQVKDRYKETAFGS